MNPRLRVELERLRERLLGLMEVVTEQLDRAVRVVESGNRAEAESVVLGDRHVDRLEVELEEECLKVLALHQPVAGDLRFVVAVLKIDGDLERIGDLAANIAQRAGKLAVSRPVPFLREYRAMARGARRMVDRAIGAFAGLDADLARRVLAADDEVDGLNRVMFRRAREELRAHPDRVDELLSALSLFRYLERIADHATNIAEDVLYLLEGEVVRHRPPAAAGK